jgi:hypothetical protein
MLIGYCNVLLVVDPLSFQVLSRVHVGPLSASIRQLSVSRDGQYVALTCADKSIRAGSVAGCREWGAAHGEANARNAAGDALFVPFNDKVRAGAAVAL